MDVRIVSVHIRYGASVDKGKPFREDHRIAWCLWLACFPLYLFYTVIHMIWISGINHVYEVIIGLLVCRGQPGSDPFLAGNSTGDRKNERESAVAFLTSARSSVPECPSDRYRLQINTRIAPN